MLKSTKFAGLRSKFLTRVPEFAHLRPSASNPYSEALQPASPVRFQYYSMSVAELQERMRTVMCGLYQRSITECLIVVDRSTVKDSGPIRGLDFWIRGCSLKFRVRSCGSYRGFRLWDRCRSCNHVRRTS